MEVTKSDGSTFDPTKSLCDQYAFNTIITRAKSLVVCVGNPFLLFSIEKSTPGYSIYCWREYIKRCLETSTLQLTPQCYEAGEAVVQTQIGHLYSEVFGDLKDLLASPSSRVHDTSDSILEAYRNVFQSSRAFQHARIILGSIEHGDQGYRVIRDDDTYEHPDKAPEDAPMDDTPIECYLESITFRKSIATPLDPKEPPITVQGINNRRCALEGARVKVHMYKDSDRFGRVCEVVEQGPQQQFVCRVDKYNAIFLSPIDRKSPRLVNLPGLSRQLLKRASEEYIIQEELRYKQRAVTVFDPKSFHIPSKGGGGGKIDIPQIKDVIPLSIAQKLLFVVLYLRWTQKYRYPLGVVIAAIPKGLTLYHGERLLLAHHHINTAPVDDLDGGVLLTLPATRSSLPYYDHAFTIDPSGAKAFDDALTLEPVASDDGKCYQLGIHITNVGGAVRKGSKADDSAQERGTAVYGSKLSPIYYPLLSEKVRDDLSLSCGKTTSAIMYTCQLCIDDKNVRVVPNTIRIHESCVQSRACLTYDEAQHLLTNRKMSLLDKKVADYNNTLSQNSAFGLQDRLILLLQISEAFFKYRVQSDDVEYSIEDVDELSSPQAYFLVRELMIWANRIAAEHVLAAFPQLALLRRQKPPNQDQMEKALEKFSDCIAYSPHHKILADAMEITMEPGPVIIMETTRKELYIALQHADLVQARNLLRITNHYPQLAVLCKEANSTKRRAEYACSSVLQQQQLLTIDSGSYLVSLPQNESEVYCHNDLACLYTHSTSPLRRYIDIVVQRLILQSLSPSTTIEWSSKEVEEICRNSSTKMSNASKFEREYNRLSISLSLAKCSQACTAYVAGVEKSLSLVIQDLDFQYLSVDHCKFRLSSITSNAKPWDASKQSPQEEDSKLDNCKTYVWKAMVTSFSGKVVMDNESLVSKNKCKPSTELVKDAMLTFYIDDATTESSATNEERALVQHCYMHG